MLILHVHGLGRKPLSMLGLAAALRRAGHRTRFFGYSPTLESVPRIVARLARLMRQLRGPVGLVGHSLGGLLLRRALADVPALNVRRLVLLGSPNPPARAAILASRFAPFRWLTRDCGRFLRSSEAVPVPTVPYTLVAGTAGATGRWSPFGNEPNDGLVSVAETRILPADEPLLVPALHTFLMDHPAVQSAVVAAMITRS
ncbi:esterase/lipase family protein [Urbifossiella limnaea]|uniref:Alpha/beta hydrolase family protein n=1 Tax=Urbifossiella limnaea TaxID=2528023 RepID=A0A517XUL9_9BACT|nr:alpha/beta fold hydrolase [Urbifossiella limnaea]QDU21184.1 Alpha/beta hydrolase family protein [Urbifossiella limnaea]